MAGLPLAQSFPEGRANERGTKDGGVSETLPLGLIGTVYFVVAFLGLQLASINASVTPIWPPTGLALFGGDRNLGLPFLDVEDGLGGVAP